MLYVNNEETMKILKIFCLSILVLSPFALLNGSENNSSKPAILVFCATGSLGSAIASNLAKDHNLILLGRNQDKLNQISETLQQEFTHKFITQVVDFTDADSLVSFEKELKKENIILSGIVVLTPRPHFGTNLLQEQHNWLDLLQTTFTGPLEALRIGLSHLKEGKVVIIAGTTSMQLMPEYGPACIIRRMWTTYSKALAHALAPKGIQVNSLSPGVVLTDFHAKKIEAKALQNNLTFEEQMQKDCAAIPMKRWAKPEEVAQATRFFLSKESDYITGVNLLQDGGTTVSY
ncbi:MAG: hypothetical protein BGO10_07660 [Chlamydia sp. 32-24]|nr:MAG: hypothetical protein BGO10_07660 [Chlamydia sp. 32-24]